MKIKGTVYKLEKIEDDVNCDYIISGKYKFQSEDKSFLAKHIFEDIEPGINDKITRGDFLVGGYNFGCGSTREQALQALLAAGIKVIIAKSFAHTFYRNAFNNGFLLIECNTDYMETKDEIEIDLKNNFLRNINKQLGIKMVPIEPAILKIYYDGGIINHLKKNKGRYNL
ncbi:MAG: 3-isopropylmalate dehydratase [Candidatus Margulisiibacteriota bacterium]|nr:MAG: hypothetical protein A2X43_02420 [Candidatus Margulisbacteria bacterium GWD2_39_127]OGI01178.1 MAG: hypothetical protein A2X42_06065 [Candidatus Margulisbacteria bacterium GWF2_38_17]OGI09813.1 MAG: hypothetical protein A2X41_09785 [Candidatus Margulisbacteria bacterium GWE2_39_32]PZM78402.1 MAG: 3-isopropylmalate dehydratase [Candidatus Margulisiibacteriota bacterium]HAR62373.1 3-isopropylmalate dehydratase [Candidatus Margulisiibacteriota bacterium]